MRVLFGVLLATLSVACAHGAQQPFVPPLRAANSVEAHSPTEDASFRLAAPAPLGEESFPRLSFDSVTLENGLRVLLVERRGFPSVAVRLHIDTEAANAGDAGGWRAQLAASVFLSPPTGVVNTAGGCGPSGCGISSFGTSQELGDALGRVASLAFAGSAPDSEYERRLAMSATLLEKGGGEGQSQVRRVARALVFGLGTLYGEPRALPRRPTLEELRALRERAFVPRASTLVVVGDIDRTAALAEIRKQFGAWTDVAPVSGKPEAPSQDTRRLVLVRNISVTQTLAAIVARGPAPRDEDYLPFQLLVRALGGSFTSASFRHVREELAASYNVSGSVDPFPEASMFVLGGNFEKSKAVDGMNGLLGAVRAARDADMAGESLDQAKRALIAGWRHDVSTNEGVGVVLGACVGLGEPLELAQEFPARVRAITPSQVRAVAQRYLDSSSLRLVLVGQPSELARIDAPSFGPASLADGYGRPIVAASSVAQAH
jgi:predicted Zn-dependent peptidase